MTSTRMTSITFALFRIVFGLVWVLHGLQKYGVFGGNPVEVGSLMGIAGLIEIVLGTLITVGLFTRPAAFLASGQMAVAYFTSHLPRSIHPLQNGGEPALLFCFAFLFIAAYGAGILSLDTRRG
ncbi:MAG: DoxX family protein [Vicinamibacterales bacterium]